MSNIRVWISQDNIQILVAKLRNQAQSIRHLKQVNTHTFNHTGSVMMLENTLNESGWAGVKRFKPV